MSAAKIKITELNFDDVGAWPKHYKIGFYASAALLVIVLANLLVFKGQREELSVLRNQESALRKEFVGKAGRAEGLQLLGRQIMELERTLQKILGKLPVKEGVPALMVGISQVASSNRLNNESFQPGPEIIKEFYGERSIALQMVGGYHQLGAFVSELASSSHPGILTVHDISLQPVKNSTASQASENLRLTATVKIHQQMDERESLVHQKQPQKRVQQE